MVTSVKRWDFSGPGDTVKDYGTTRSKTSAGSLKVGDKVVMRIGGGERRGVVVEDRGQLGLGGRQIVVVRVGSENEGRRLRLEPKTSNASSRTAASTIV
jgi:hypothetical protein